MTKSQETQILKIAIETVLRRDMRVQIGDYYKIMNMIKSELAEFKKRNGKEKKHDK
jgi:hypothetical protein